MRSPTSLLFWIVQFLFLVPCIVSATTSQLLSSATIYYWPLDSLTPSQLAQISYDPKTLQTSISSYTPPKSPLDSEIVRVGLYDSSTKGWRGSVTTGSAFSLKKLLLSLQLDAESGEVYNVGASEPSSATLSKLAKKGQEGERLLVELVHAHQGAQPKLNKPVVLNAEGKIPEKEPERSFLQKYWWIFLAVAVLAMSGGGGDK